MHKRVTFRCSLAQALSLPIRFSFSVCRWLKVESRQKSQSLHSLESNRDLHFGFQANFGFTQNASSQSIVVICFSYCVHFP
jgi:hypothetical protein